MATGNYSRPAFTGSFWKGRPRLLDQYDEERERERTWKLRKKQLIARDGAGCFITKCKKAGYDPHHLLMRSKGGTDDLHNLVYLCRDHHREAHAHVLKFSWKDDTNRAKTCRYEFVR
jgi:hypothetical protein